MAIISFWNEGTEETGKSSAIAAIATFLGVNHNYKTLILNTGCNDYFYQDCFWKENKAVKSIKDNNFMDIGEGIRGLSRAVLSNKISPEIVTNYTKIVFNDNRLEILMDINIMQEEYEMHKKTFKDIAKMANRYYDLIFIDINNLLDENTKESLLEISNLVVACIPQKIRSINNYVRARKQKTILQEKAVLPLIGRYDLNSKYNAKVISKYIKEKQGVATIPYNTVFMEACNEAKVADLFIKYMNVGKKDKMAPFINGVSESTEKIIYKLQELQMKM